MKRFYIVLLCLVGCGQPNPKEGAVIGFTGDVMLGRLVNQVIKKTNVTYPWGTMLPLLKENDLTIINLETTLTKSKKAVPKVFNFKSDPEHVQVLVQGGIDIVSLANNHALDFSQEGLRETIKVLNQEGITFVGAGENAEQAQRAAIVRINNLSIGLLGYTDNEPSWKAEGDKPGTNYIAVGDLERVQQDIAKVRDKVDILIATLHWGPNMRQRPTKEFIAFAHALIDSGIDIIHGHSAHIFQGVELYKGKLIMYDTGDFVDDYRVTPRLRNDTSFLFRVHTKNKHLQKLELIPVLISNMQVNHAPEELAGEIIEKMQRLSSELGTTVEIVGQRGYINVR